jgi:uncharacterized protein YegL
MSDEEMHLVQNILTSALDALRGDPNALETVWLSCISFDSRAVAHSRLTDLISFQLPVLNRHPFEDGDISVAMNTIEDFCSTNVRRSSVTQKGDWRPVVCIFTNGKCLNGWDRVGLREYAVFLVGENASVTNAKRLSETILECSEDSGDVIRSFFRIVS